MSGVNPASNDAHATPANAGGAPAGSVTETDPLETPPANAGGAAAVNQRLLEESKAWKARALKAEQEKAEADKKKAEEQGAYKELYEKEKQEKEGLKKMIGRKTVEQAVKEAAAKAGCVRPAGLLKLGKQDLLKWDEESLSVEGVEAFVADAKKEYPELFQAVQTPTVNPTTPGGVVKPKPALTAAELAKLPNTDPRKREAWARAIQAKQGQRK